MKKITLLISISFFFLFLNAQEDCETPQQHIIKSNRIAGYIYNDGSIFHGIEGGGFKFPYTGINSPSTIAGAGLWLGGVAEDGSVKVAASSYCGTITGTDFIAGALDPATGLSYENIPCEYLNKIWTVNKDEILSFLDDWYDNEKIDGEHESIFSWPGNGNPHFPINPLPITEQGWAPFYDMDEDGIYNPKNGDFPLQNIENNNSLFIPNEINWTVFHDFKWHEESGGWPMNVEVQQTTWVRECDSQPEIENTVFVEYKIINRSFEDIDSFHAGILVDFNIGCYLDDYIGSIPELNSFMGYNSIENDGDPQCQDGTLGYNNSPPVMSVKFLEGFNGGGLDHFMYYFRIGFSSPPSGQTPPNNPHEFYNYLTGRWRDGTPLTFGERGYDPVGINPNFTDFVFPGNPNNVDEWTMYSFPTFFYGSHQAVGSTGFSNYSQSQENGFKLKSGESVHFSLAFTCHSNPAYNHIEIIDRMIADDLKNLELGYNNGYGANGFYCQNFNIEEPDPEPEEPFISGIYPNPTSSEFTIAIPETTIEEVEIYNTALQLIYSDKNSTEEIKKINISGWANGLYFLKIKLDGHVLMRKIIKD